MENSQAYTVPEFAKKIGVSSQYVYKLLGKKLKPYVVTQGQKRLILIDAIKLFNVPEDKHTENEQAVKSAREYEQRISDLEKQVAEQAAIIEQLKNQLNEKKEDANKLYNLFNQQQQLMAMMTKQLEAPKRRIRWPWQKKDNQ